MWNHMSLIRRVLTGYITSSSKKGIQCLVYALVAPEMIMELGFFP